MIGGFYNWHRAFNGEFHLYKAKEDELENYDIVFIGMSRPELEGVTASRIREKIGWNSKTKLVICIDYAIELWQGVFQPNLLERELMQADMIFVSEPTMLSYVRALLNDRKKVFHIVHPTQVEDLQKLRKPIDMRTDEIVTIVHRYDNNWLAPYLVTKDLKWNNHVVLLDGKQEMYLYAYFKYMKSGFEFLKYLDWASRKKVVLDSYHKIHTYGRSPVDNACIGIPNVGTDWTYSQKYLWPKLTTQPGYLRDQTELIKKLMTDNSFYKDVIDEATEKVKTFNYENRKKDFLNKLYN